MPVVFELPAPTPANKFSDPALLKMRWPPRLYCIAALTVFIDNVPLTIRLPPITPSPEILKLLDGCVLVVFFMKPPAGNPSSCPELVAVSAAAAVTLRTAYGVEVSGWRGLSVV